MSGFFLAAGFHVFVPLVEEVGVRGEETEGGLLLELFLEAFLAKLLALGEEFVADVGRAVAAVVTERVDVTVDLGLALEEETRGGEDLLDVAGGEGGVEKCACGVEGHKELVCTGRLLKGRAALGSGERGLGTVGLLVTVDLVWGERELSREIAVRGCGREGRVDFSGSGRIT